MIAAIDVTSVCDTIKRTKLIEIPEWFLRADEIYIIRIPLTNTTLDIKSSSNISNPFDKNIVSPQGDGLRGYLFITYLEKALRTLRAIGEHSYADSFKSTLPEKCINADDTDLINDSAEKKKRQLRLVTLLLN